MLLDGGVYKSQVLISPATLQELLAPQVIVPGAPEIKECLPLAYGFGWRVFSYLGHYYVSHDGVSDGFTSVTGIFPSDGIGIVVLSNKNMTNLPRFLSFQMIDKLLNLPPRKLARRRSHCFSKKTSKHKKTETVMITPKEKKGLVLLMH